MKTVLAVSILAFSGAALAQTQTSPSTGSQGSYQSPSQAPSNTTPSGQYTSPDQNTGGQGKPNANSQNDSSNTNTRTHSHKHKCMGSDGTTSAANCKSHSNQNMPSSPSSTPGGG